jgi:hypothetical protein
LNFTTVLVQETNETDNETLVQGSLSYADRKMTFTPMENLSYNTTYRVTLTSGIKDLAGNNLSTDFSWSFTTAAEPDRIPPKIVSIFPPNGSVGVPVNTVIVVNFSEHVRWSKQPIILLHPNGTKVEGDITFNASTFSLCFAPTTSLDFATTYHVIVLEEITDRVGNKLGENYTFVFTTETAPYLPVPEEEGKEQETAITLIYIGIFVVIASVLIVLYILIRSRKGKSLLPKLMRRKK